MTDGPRTEGPGRAGGMFRALSHRNFRLFWAGAFLSNAGIWMQTVAQSWLVLELTNSGTWLGIDNFMATAPGVVLILVGGVIADLVDRKRLLIYTQVGAGAAALVLALLVAAGVVEVWMILALTFVTGCCWALSGPSYQAITVDLVAREDLANAIALNSSQFQLARVFGPLLAGLTIRTFGLAGCFLANGLSYVAIVAALMRVRFDKAGGASPTGGGPEQAPGGAAREGQEAAASGGAAAGAPARALNRRAIWSDLVGGFSYVRGRPRVSIILLCSALVSLFGAPYLVLMPLFAKNLYGWGETGLSLMVGTAGAGALVGALTLAYLGDLRRKGLFVLASAFAGGACIVGFSWAARPWAGLALLFGTGLSMVCFFAVGNTLLQQLVRDEMRGRVMSMWLLTFVGTMPVGSFLSGYASDRVGPRPTLAACGLVIVLFAVAVGALNPRLREI